MEKRIVGIDLLRIVSVLMVVVLHILSLWQMPFGGISYHLKNLLKSFVICCVDVFAIISGYVGLNSKHNIRKLTYYWMTVVFYAVIISFILFLISLKGTTVFSLKQMILSFLPVITFRYWYFSAYFLLFFFMPVIDTFVNNASANS